MSAAAATSSDTPLALPSVIGHRGAAMAAPENTLAGMRKAKAQGARWVEFDVRLCADGRCILLHDDTIDRTSDGTGEAARQSFTALRERDFGGWFDPAFAGERIPSLEEAIDVLGALGLGANVELKPAAGAEIETARVAMAILRRRWPAHLPPPLVSSFVPAALAAAREAAPEIRRGYLVEELPVDWRRRAEALACASIHTDQRRLDGALARGVVAAGYPLLAYTVNDPARARVLREWGVTAIFTDCPDRIIAALDER